jgi:hypothetical protein
MITEVAAPQRNYAHWATWRAIRAAFDVPDHLSFAQWLSSEESRVSEFLKFTSESLGLDAKTIAALREDWGFWARADQLPPGYGHTSHGRRFYRCGKNCGRKNVRAEPIERRAFTDAYDLLSDPRVIRELYKRQKAADPEKSAVADAMASVSIELERLPEERKRVMDAYQRGVGDITDLQKRLGRIDAREERLKKDLSSLQSQGEASISQAERREAWMAAAKALKDFRLGRGDSKQARRASMKALLLEWSPNGKTPGLFETQQTIVRAVYEKVVHRPGKDLLYAATVPLSKGKPMWAIVTRRGSSTKLARIRAS